MYKKIICYSVFICFLCLGSAGCQHGTVPLQASPAKEDISSTTMLNHDEMTSESLTAETSYFLTSPSEPIGHGNDVDVVLEAIHKYSPDWKVDPNDWKRIVVWLDANYDAIKDEDNIDLPAIDTFLETHRKKWNQENKEKKDGLPYQAGMDYQTLLKECPLLHEIELDTNPDTYLEPYRRVQEEEEYIVTLINQQDPNRHATLDSWKKNVVWLDFHYDELKSKPDVDLTKVDSYREAYHSVWRCEGLPLDRKEGETSPSRPKNVQDIPEYQELFKAMEDELNKK